MLKTGNFWTCFFSQISRLSERYEFVSVPDSQRPYEVFQGGRNRAIERSPSQIIFLVLPLSLVFVS